MLENFVFYPNKATATLQESMTFFQVIMKQSLACNMDLEIESEILCTIRAKEILENIELWRKYFKEDEENAK